MNDRERLDPVYESDRVTGSTKPESGTESSNVVGRPADKPGDEAFHETTETDTKERTDFDASEALESGGSFDGLGVPVVER
ncbi:MAG: hypothetical protein IAI50_12985 [Candidatus Eremiobacteraeota bacterium]|nr:hypothetical protein [Candidatus Eremiobacteraeota bacterium]